MSQTRATFVIHWPPGAGTAATKRRQTLSASTQSVSVSVNGGSGTVVNKPTLTGSPSTTSISIFAPPGNDEFTFTAWDQLDASGAILDQSTVSQNIIADANNSVSVVLDGVCAALVPALSGTLTYVEPQNTSVPLASGSRTLLKSARLVGPNPATVVFSRVDADGNTILTSAGTAPLSVTESGTTPHVKIAAASSGAANTAFTLTPTVAEPDGFATTITAMSPDCGTGTPTFPSSFQLSTSAEIVVADYYYGLIAYDQDGTQTAQISTTQYFSGIAYNPKSNYLVALEAQNSGTGEAIAFQTLTPTGSVIGSGTIAPQNGCSSLASQEQPGNIVYSPQSGSFDFALQSIYNSSTSSEEAGAIEQFLISGSTATFQYAECYNTTDPFSLASLPDGIAVNDLIASNYDTMLYESNLEFAPYSAAISTNALAFDSTRGTLFTVADANKAGTAAGGIVFDQLLNIVATFVYPHGLGGQPLASAYNPSTDEFYLFMFGGTVTGLPGSTVYQGGSLNSNLSQGAFPGLFRPEEAVVLP